MTDPLEVPLISATDFGRMADEDCITELVRGTIERSPLLIPFVGFICGRVAMEIDKWVRERSLGLVLLKSGIVTERHPDTVRGADVSYYSESRLPDRPFQRDCYWEIVPDLIVEVRSPSDKWQKTLQKVSEYLSAGVSVVMVIDPSSNSANVYRDEGSPETFGPDDTLTIPDLLPGFSVPISRFFQ